MRTFAVVVVMSGLVLMRPLIGQALSASEMKQAHPVSVEFQKIRALAGRWKGTSSGPEGKDQPAAIEYRVTSGGSAVVETLFPGTEHEMVTVYHDRHGKLAATHYCMLGNQPELTLTSAAPNQMDLSLAPESSVKAETETHMHALTLAWADPNHLTQTWTLFEQGKATSTTTITVAREQ